MEYVDGESTKHRNYRLERFIINNYLMRIQTFCVVNMFNVDDQYIYSWQSYYSQ